MSHKTQPQKNHVFRPLWFHEILQHLRLHRQLSVTAMAKKIRYSETMIRTYETQTKNPSIKMLVHYIEGLDLSLIVTPEGLTIVDLHDGGIILDNWSLDFIR